jgi:hypothetical protein
VSTTNGFDPGVVARLDAAKEIRIETRIRGSAEGGTRRTTIWVVVDDGEIFVRSEFGARGRWFQDLLADPRATLHIGRRDEPIAAVARLATDPASVERCTAGFQRKYAGNPAVAVMVIPEIDDATVRLEPDTEAAGPGS